MFLTQVEIHQAYCLAIIKSNCLINGEINILMAQIVHTHNVNKKALVIGWPELGPRRPIKLEVPSFFTPLSCMYPIWLLKQQICHFKCFVIIGFYSSCMQLSTFVHCKVILKLFVQICVTYKKYVCEDLCYIFCSHFIAYRHDWLQKYKQYMQSGVGVGVGEALLSSALSYVINIYT